MKTILEKLFFKDSLKGFKNKIKALKEMKVDIAQ